MVKKRGGRRGKAKDEPSHPSTSESHQSVEEPIPSQADPKPEQPDVKIPEKEFGQPKPGFLDTRGKENQRKVLGGGPGVHAPSADLASGSRFKISGRGRGSTPINGLPRPGPVQPEAPLSEPRRESGVVTHAPSKDQTLDPTWKRGPGRTSTLQGPLLAPRKKLTNFAEIEKQLEAKPGTCGRRIRVETNHLKLELGDLQQMYRYDVSVDPDKPKKMLKTALNLFRLNHFPENHPSYDGQKIMVSAMKLPFLDDTISGTVVLKSDNNRDMEFKITIKLTGVVDLSPLNNLLQKNISQEEAFQCVEIVFRQAYTQSFVSVGRRFFTPARPGENPVGLGAQMYLGGCQAAVKGWIPFLNVDVSHKAFTTEISIKDLIIEMFSTRGRPIYNEDLPRYKLMHWQVSQLEDYLKGLKIIYQIPNHEGSKKIYKINGLKKSPLEETCSINDRTATINDYFNERWHYKLKFNNLQTLWVGTKGNILLPMELCKLQAGQPLSGSKVTDSQTRQIIRLAATSTTERKNKIRNLIKEAGYNDNQCIQECGFSISDQFQQLDARVLDPPELKYFNGNQKPNKGVWEGRQYLKGAKIQKWTVVGVAVQRDRIKDGLGEMAKMIMDYGNKNGMTFAPPAPFEYISGEFSAVSKFLYGKKAFDLIIVVISSFNKDLYYTVKQAAELNVGCLTQCVTSDTVSRRLSDATIKNILLKLNSKLNGTTHVIHKFNLIDDEPCMVMGADVTHPSPQAQNIPSVVAVTASHDLNATNYNISLDLQKPRTEKSEIIQRMEEITLDKLRKFVAKTGKEPKKIYFFRDGVSEGEFKRVKEVEIQSIIRACNAYRRGFRPKITFLVVQKRHHTRFFPFEREDSGGDRHFNVPAGTCVDTVITDPTKQNFYLLSHASIQGVSRPTKYCTLLDENNLSNDDVERLTYYLCHVFARCNRSVSYPAPTYYAHLAADRAKGYLRGKTIDMEHLNLKLIKINDQLSERNPMYFI